jgi:hypothetical protein
MPSCCTQFSASARISPSRPTVAAGTVGTEQRLGAGNVIGVVFFDQREQLAEQPFAARQRQPHVVADRNLAQYVRHRHAQRGGHHGHQAGDERRVAQIALLRVQSFDQQLHEAAAQGRQLEQWVVRQVDVRAATEKQQLQPALQLATPEHGDGVAHGGNAGAGTDTHRIGQAQQVDDQCRFGAEGGIEHRGFGVLGRQPDQAQQALGRGIQLASLDNHRPGKIVALKQMEAEQPAKLHLRLRFDVSRDQRATRGAQRPCGRLQPISRQAVDIDLEPGGKIDQWPDPVVDVGDAGQREGVAAGLEFLALGQKGFFGKGRDVDFEHHNVFRQQLDQVTAEKQGVDIDEGTYLAEHIGKAELGEGLADNVRGCRCRRCFAIDAGGVFFRGAEQQFVAGQALILVEDGLAAYEYLAQLIARFDGFLVHAWSTKAGAVCGCQR